MAAAERPRPMKGPYEDPFWSYVAQGELRLQRCSDCGAYRYPPAAICAECLSDQYEWVPLAGTGRLFTWAVFERQYFPSLPVPYNVAVVQMDEGPFLIANVVGVEPRALTIDMPVRVTFQEVEPGLTLFLFTPA